MQSAKLRDLPGDASLDDSGDKLDQFYIPAATSLQERRLRALKHGDTFAVFDPSGDALSGPNSSEGIFHRDTRHLSHLSLTIGGLPPILLSSTLRDDNANLTCDLTNPAVVDDDGKVVLGHDQIHLRRTRFLWDGICFERLALRNFDSRLQKIRLELTFAADFADLFEVRGMIRARRGHQQKPSISADAVVLAYVGLDDKRRGTRLRFEPAPASLTADQAVFDLELAPRESRTLFVEIRCNEGLSPLSPSRAFFAALFRSRRALRTSAARATAIATSNDTFNEGVRRSVSDTYMLLTDTPQGPYPYAGIPWFSTAFGRDALITALETLWLDPTIACGVLGYLAANQAKTADDASDAEPGKILHEVRHGEMAELGEVPFRCYYGSIDSTPLFVMLAGAYLGRTGDVATLEKLWPNIEAALSWIETDGDRDGDGFVEYGRKAADGLINQGWKDSHDSISHEDGTIARGPIALVEVQAYVYAALQAAAGIALQVGASTRANELTAKAELLRQRFDAAFFDEKLGTYVLALDGDKRPCRVRTSNAGHALFTGIALPERAPAVVETLMSTSSFSGWGVRTLAATEARYNPMSYHNGSVWPHDNALVAAGFARYGFRREAARIFEGLFAASIYIDLRRLPELFCGFPRQRGRGPTFYPVACSPQAWSAATPLSLLQSSLGVGFDAGGKQIVFDRPVFPEFLTSVELKRLEIGGAKIDVMLEGTGSAIVVRVLSRDGDIRVLTRS